MIWLGGLALALASLWLAPAALAAPPANDNFADAEVLGPGLPVAVSRTNVEATKEVGEPFVGAASSNGSVWFEWVAPGTGFVTIGTCNGQIRAILGVFTGTTVGSLTKVAEGNANEGPNCPFSGREYTFKAIAGTSYKIGVAGDAFFLPGAPKPVTEGEFELRIESTPPPANDDFGDAVALQGGVSEEPGGARPYFASGLGYNWGATKEAGEPNHGGDPGGASVWFSWTAPDSGLARITACCAPATLLSVYAGGSVDTLIPILPGPPFGISYAVSAGTIYRIAVDGKFDAGANAAAMGPVEVRVFMQLPALPGAAQVSTSNDQMAPSTAIRKRKVKAGKRRATFTFASSEPGSKFRCRLDGKPFAACKSPKTYKNLKPGRHTFKVVAIDPVGNADPTPAIATFSIPKPRAR